MRQGQQNRRGRGRSTSNNNNSNNNHTNNNNHNSGRKPQNPLSRNFESSGPDVKIRGTAAQIAEKYITLARDASSSGDYIMAENYLQHAEHYNRIIMAAQQAQVVTQHPHGGEHAPGLNGQYRPQQENGGGFAMRDQPQPVIEQPQPQNQQPVVPPGMEPQPEVTTEPAVISGEADDTAPPRGADVDGRRRRRRYPAGGAPRAAGNAAEPAASANGHNGSGNGNGLDGPGDGRPSDEVLAN
jgi:hypothetical protein